MEGKAVAKKKRGYVGMGASLLVVFVLFFLFKQSEWLYDWYHSFYFRIELPILQFFHSFLGGLMYIMLLVIVLIRLVKVCWSKTWREGIRRLADGITSVVVWFFILWGFHYAQPTLEPEESLSHNELSSLYQGLLTKTNDVRESLGDNFKRDTGLDSEMKSRVNVLLKEEAKRFTTKGRGCTFPFAAKPYGGLRTLGISGIYFPFTGEPLYDDSATRIRGYFTYAHEFFHSRAVTGEDECNYLAYKTLVNSGEEELMYSAYLDALLTCKYLLGITNDEFSEDVSPEVVSDLEFIRENARKYKSWFHSVSRSSNDLYLKLLSSSEGEESYNSYVKWIEL